MSGKQDHIRKVSIAPELVAATRASQQRRNSKRFSFSVQQQESEDAKARKASLRAAGAGQTYLAGTSQGDSVDARSMSVSAKPGDAQFPLHCVSVRDVMEFKTMPNHAEIARLGKFVNPSNSDPRKVVFVSHQWTAAPAPDPTGTQWGTFKAALKRMLEGKVLKVNESIRGTLAEIPARSFAKDLADCLIWVCENFINVTSKTSIVPPVFFGARGTVVVLKLKALFHAF